MTTVSHTQISGPKGPLFCAFYVHSGIIHLSPLTKDPPAAFLDFLGC